MAGSLAIVRTEDAQDPVDAISDQWEIQFARFFGYPPISSSCPGLSPLLLKSRKRRPHGTWISSSSSAFLRLVNDHSNSDVILTVSLRGKILIQKFALRFSTTYETEIFINSLKEILNDVSDIAPLNNDLGSEILSQTELVSSNRHSNRACEELSFMPPEQTYTPQMSPSLNNEMEQHSSNLEKDTAFRHDFEETVAALPPSFTSLLTNCCSEVNQAQSTVCKEADLKSQIVKYMEDSAFQDMLITVEKVISEMGGDLTL
ncbi:hypothetical protein I3843_05G164400 [Carya illinoinensis]|uniref:Poor homologous synapsis 1 PH domain-containing protein n=1 Tax=Carya illinoinensis TaxID=32201 RepID=A0A8T1QLG8_CARIL|nr:hypothetical protein CIPAW_05G183700 [Carya illinoinensis]KAG6713972.1 hypothetical protein I3842_05G179700 [Carya illinoinensis]KAG7980105.1 hypothetical protein I3843_05G164400 [Carya illinoinensis]